MDIYHTVYQTTNLVNGKTYIGAHVTGDPWDSYLGSGVALARAIQKHGRESFSKTVLAVFDNPEDMWATEARLVNESFISTDRTYNSTLGGRGQKKGHTFTLTAKEKLAQAAIGNSHAKGRVAVNNGHEIRMVYPDQIPEGWTKGTIRTPEHAAKLAAFAKQPKSLETRRRISNAVLAHTKGTDPSTTSVTS